MATLYSAIHYWLVDHPTISQYQWKPNHTVGTSKVFVTLTVSTYLTLTLFLHHFPVLPTLSPATLRLITASHNLILCFISFLMAIGCTLSSLHQSPPHNLSWPICFPLHHTPPRGPTFFWANVFYFSKILEFIDTLLILLSGSRSRRLSFLHVYHHAVVVVMCYLWLSTSQSLFPVALVTNASVHVLMYGYYLLCAVGIRPSWKRLVTDCQIIQFVFSFLISGIRLTECTRFTIINYCEDTIWPGITPNNFSGGFALKPKETKIFTSPPTWNGRIWARTGCDFDTNGTGRCQTGSCGRALQCSGPGQPPSSIAQFSLGDVDYYDVSLVDGFNLPIVVKPVGGKGICSSAGCDSDLRPNCSSELALEADGKIIACQSACSVFNTDEYCCRGAYSAPMACLPTNYSRTFKTACPAAYSFAHDDATSVMTCSSTDYVVTFCSSRNQTECTYHDGKLSCNGSSSSGRLTKVTQTWKLKVMAFAVAISIQVML